MRGRVVVHAHQVDIHMHCKSVCTGCGCLPSVEVVIPAPCTLSPVSPAAQMEMLPSTIHSLLGCFHDILSCG